MDFNKKTILYVDDDEDDVELLCDAIKQINPNVHVAVAKNGLEALNYLQSVTSKLPCLVVLDLNMPYLDGKQTFHKIKADPSLQNIPVVIFTSSANPNDKDLFNSLGIEFITKPHSYDAINKIAGQMLENC